MMVTRQAGSIAAAALVALALGACGSQASTMGAKTITVNASSEVQVVPDKADFGIEVMAQGDTAEKTQAASEAPVKAVLKALRDGGVDDKAIQTTYVNLAPEYDWNNGTSTIVGYQMSTHLQVRGVDIDKVSPLMQACVAAGATGVDGPTYSSTSFDEAYAQALAEAVAASKPKAEAMAEAANVTLGAVSSIDEGYEDTSYRNTGTMAVEDSLAKDAGGMEIAPGEVTVSAQVTVSYEIR